MTEIIPLAPGQLVCWNQTTSQPRDIVVQPREALDRLCLNIDLTRDGWRLATSCNGWSALVRRTGSTRWAAAWDRFVDVVEVCEVDTVAVATPDGRGAIVAELGKRIRLAWARRAA